MACPLERRRFPAASEGMIPLCHWGILVSQMAMGQMMDRIDGNTSDAEDIWGDLHELRNNHGISQYERRDFKTPDYQRATRLKYLGQTEMTDKELHDYGE
jgi:hypothetical protein